jgi:Tol biopolymer transport system component/DNA-binding winged helix-turn-helix (wHTH) protein
MKSEVSRGSLGPPRDGVEQIESVVRFASFELNLNSGELWKSGIRIRLQEQPFKVLAVLLECPGKVVSRKELRERIWPGSGFGDFDHAINLAIGKLRDTLGDSADAPRLIETLPRHGYRFIAKVECLSRGMESGSISIAPSHRWKWLHLAVALLLGIGLSATVLTFVRPSPKASATGLTSVPLTARPGYESEPSFSPDGNQVAFSWYDENEGESHLCVKLIGAGGPPLQLTKGPASDVNPVWSPDGRFIAFLRAHPGGAAILLIPALGGPERKIAEIHLGGGLSPYQAWSPDGNFLVISHRDSPNEPAALFVVATDTGEKRRLTSPPFPPASDFSGDTNPAFSPDGRTLAFIRLIDQRSELYLLTVSDTLQPMGEARRIPLGHLSGTTLQSINPAWTDDGREIVFSRWHQGLWRIDVSESAARFAEPQQLPFGESACCPTISRRGHRLAYSNDSVHTSIWRMAIPDGPISRGGTKVRSFNRPFISSTQDDIDPQFSPDGRRIAFVSVRSGDYEVWVCNSDGSSPVQLTSFHGPYVTTPRWSPDGRRIAFDSDAGGEFDIWVIGADGGKPVRMTTHPANDGNPSWSHDGRWIYFDSARTGEQQVWKLPGDGGEAIQVTRDRGYAPLESPDGKFLYYTKNLTATSLWRIPLDGGQATEVLEGLSGYFNLAIVDKGIYFVPQQDAPSPYSIQFLDLQTNKIRQIASFEKPISDGIALSPDGLWILYSQTEKLGTELRLVENFH